MLQVKKINKKYVTGDLTQVALDNVSLDFRNNEFVAILGPSGSGKTTLLNIIGGLDRYDSGDLIINGVSTKEYKDRDWDAYRNHNIGFIFQSYNLIPHQSVLSNVELSLTLSNISREEKKNRALEALKNVGLEEQAHKKPNQLSGGQMQRVAIARALVNNPDIILADEPTGALDSKTSIQVMDLLKEVAKDRLVIMVTHNPELAQEYATRIVNLKDGRIISDSMPVETETTTQPFKKVRTKLGFLTALSLSLNNLMTKKGRTALTSFAGSIGIIGIALILALSNGVNQYIADEETEMLGSYPIQLETQAMDLNNMLNLSTERKEGGEEHTKDGIYSNNIVADSVKADDEMFKENDLASFKTYLDKNQAKIKNDITSIEYKYKVTPYVYRNDKKEGLVKVSPSRLSDNLDNVSSTSSMSGAISSSWQELVSNQTLRDQQYELLEGSWPKKPNEVALIITKNKEISDYTLYTLGLMDISDMKKLIKDVTDEKDYKDKTVTMSYKDALGKTFKVLAPAQFYKKSDDVYLDKSDDEKYVKSLLKDATEVKITAILQSNDTSSIRSGVGYDASLTKHLMDVTYDTDIVQEQLSHKTINVLTGKKFSNKKTKMTMQTFMQSRYSYATNPIKTVLKEEDIAKTYTVRFLNYDGTVLSSKTYKEGEEVTLPSNNPSRTATDKATYVFIGWQSSKDNSYYRSGTIPTVSDNVDYTAMYYELITDASDQTNTQSVQDIINSIASQNNMSPEELQNYITEQLNITPEEITQEDVNQIVNQSLTDEEIAKFIEDFIKENPDIFNNTTVQNVMKEYIKNNASNLISEEDIQKYMKEYMKNNADSLISQKDIEKYMKDYIKKNGSNLISSKDMEKYITEYLKKNASSLKLSDAQIQSLMGQYMKKYQKQIEEQLKGQFNMNLTDDQLSVLLAQMSDITPNTYDDVMSALGYYTLDTPSSINIYPISFDGKEKVIDFIDTYNKGIKDDKQKVTYTDIIGIVTDSITSIVDTISYILIAFVGISLVVSSIMIAIITYISVLERIKEIGILRAMGASKNDISKIFNAETFIEGLLSGVFGIIATLLLCIPINQIVYNIVEVENLAQLPMQYAFVLILISVVLTLIAGFLPSRIASKKDPVTALRTE